MRFRPVFEDRRCTLAAGQMQQLEEPTEVAAEAEIRQNTAGAEAEPRPAAEEEDTAGKGMRATS